MSSLSSATHQENVVSHKVRSHVSKQSVFHDSPHASFGCLMLNERSLPVGKHKPLSMRGVSNLQLHKAASMKMTRVTEAAERP